MAYRPKDTQERILHRLKISLGHLKKIIKMVQEDAYCIDVIHQTRALQEALAQTENVILENHLQTCVAGDIKKGNEKKAVEEIMQVFKKRKK